jgi:hypothetical protein
MLAIVETGSILERLTSFLTEVFGGDDPVGRGDWWMRGIFFGIL